MVNMPDGFSFWLIEFYLTLTHYVRKCAGNKGSQERGRLSMCKIIKPNNRGKKEGKEPLKSSTGRTGGGATFCLRNRRALYPDYGTFER